MRKLVIAVALAVSMTGCAYLGGLTAPSQATLDAQARAVAEAELVYTGLAHAGAQYVHCGEPTYLPCIGGPPNADAVVRIRQLDNAAYAALQSARARVNAHQDATSLVAVLSAAVVAFTAYEVSSGIQKP